MLNALKAKLQKCSDAKLKGLIKKIASCLKGFMRNPVKWIIGAGF